MTDYLSGTNVQLGASYAVSKDSTSLYARGYEAAAHYINASTDEIGPSIPCLSFPCHSDGRWEEEPFSYPKHMRSSRI